MLLWFVVFGLIMNTLCNKPFASLFNHCNGCVCNVHSEFKNNESEEQGGRTLFKYMSSITSHHFDSFLKAFLITYYFSFQCPTLLPLLLSYKHSTHTNAVLRVFYFSLLRRWAWTNISYSWISGPINTLLTSVSSAVILDGMIGKWYIHWVCLV